MTTHPCYLLQYARHALLRIGKMAEGGEMSTVRCPNHCDALLLGQEQSRAAVCANVVCISAVLVADGESWVHVADGESCLVVFAVWSGLGSCCRERKTPDMQMTKNLRERGYWVESHGWSRSFLCAWYRTVYALGSEGGDQAMMPAVFIGACRVSCVTNTLY